MKIALCEHIDLTDMSSLETTISRLCPQRYQQAIQYKNPFMHWACLKTFEMLFALLQREGVEITPPITLSYNTNGKPSLDGIDVHFNISHCKKALLVGINDTPIGVDIEDLSRKVNPILYDRVLSPQERQQVRTPQDFLTLWTRKEAVLKLRGIGLQQISLLPDVLNETDLSDTTLTTIPDLAGRFIYTIAQSH